MAGGLLGENRLFTGSNHGNDHSGATPQRIEGTDLMGGPVVKAGVYCETATLRFCALSMDLNPDLDLRRIWIWSHTAAEHQAIATLAASRASASRVAWPRYQNVTAELVSTINRL